jgi:DNA-binding IclR family transcriptional regulator
VLRPKVLRNPEHVQVLVRAFSILEVLARSPAGLSLRDLSRQVGLHKSTAFRMLRTMAMLGYVVQIEDSKHYRIGDRMPAIARRPSRGHRGRTGKAASRRDRQERWNH